MTITFIFDKIGWPFWAQMASIWPPFGAQMAAQRWVIDRLVNHPPLAADFGIDLGRLGPVLAPFGSP